MLDNQMDNPGLVLGTLVGYLKRKERRDFGEGWSTETEKETDRDRIIFPVESK